VSTPPKKLKTLEIPLGEIAPLANVRPELDTDIDELAASIAEHGQLEPVRARPALTAEHGKPYELVFGYRRYAAAAQLGLPTLRCEVCEVSDEELPLIQLAENLPRESMTPIQVARALEQLTQTRRPADLARELGKDESWISRTRKLLQLPDDVQARIDAGTVSRAVADEIAAIKDRDGQLKALELAERNNWDARKVGRWRRERNKNFAAGITDTDGQAADDLPGAFTLITPDDVVPLAQLNLRSDLSQLDYDRLDVWALLRNGMNQRRLEELAGDGISWEQLWLYVCSLDKPGLHEERRRLLREYAQAAHRFYDLDLELVADLGVPGDAIKFTPTPKEMP